MRESRTLGSVRAKAEWLSYSTIPGDYCSISDYPMDRKGYLRWRTTLYAFHAEKASELRSGHVVTAMRRSSADSDTAPEKKSITRLTCDVALTLEGRTRDARLSWSIISSAFPGNVTTSAEEKAIDIDPQDDGRR